jgi:hypothetical protein
MISARLEDERPDPDDLHVQRVPQNSPEADAIHSGQGADFKNLRFGQKVSRTNFIFGL